MASDARSLSRAGAGMPCQRAWRPYGCNIKATGSYAFTTILPQSSLIDLIIIWPIVLNCVSPAIFQWWTKSRVGSELRLPQLERLIKEKKVGTGCSVPFIYLFRISDPISESWLNFILSKLLSSTASEICLRHKRSLPQTSNVSCHSKSVWVAPWASDLGDSHLPTTFNHVPVFQ